MSSSNQPVPTNTTAVSSAGNGAGASSASNAAGVPTGNEIQELIMRVSALQKEVDSKNQEISKYKKVYDDVQEQEKKKEEAAKQSMVKQSNDIMKRAVELLEMVKNGSVQLQPQDAEYYSSLKPAIEEDAKTLEQQLQTSILADDKTKSTDVVDATNQAWSAMSRALTVCNLITKEGQKTLQTSVEAHKDISKLRDALINPAVASTMQTTASTTTQKRSFPHADEWVKAKRDWHASRVGTFPDPADRD